MSGVKVFIDLAFCFTELVFRLTIEFTRRDLVIRC